MFPQCNHHIAATILLAIGGLCTLGTGCQNNKNALSLELIPNKKVFLRGDPIEIDATFKSRDGTVCIDKPKSNRFEGKLVALDSNQSLGHGGIGHCGMLGLLLVPAIPAMYGYSVMDVADTIGRFQLVHEDRPVTHSFIIHPYGKRFLITSADGHSSPDFQSDQQLSEGRYRLQLTFQRDDKKTYPPPLFWRVYDAPVTATTEFEIVKR